MKRKEVGEKGKKTTKTKRKKNKNKKKIIKTFTDG